MSAPAIQLPAIELIGVSKRFGKTLDAAAKFAQRIKRSLGGEVREQVVRAVDNVDMEIYPGEVVGLVGESGCGKSTLGRMVAGILPPSDGQVLWQGRDITTLSPNEARAAKLKIQMIFQNPYASLNPRLRVAEIVGEAPRVHGLVDRAGFDDYVDAQLRRAGLDPAFKRRYPHQFSGGQRQRIGIARALAVQPEFLVCDEAVAALDVSIQAQILNLFMDLRARLDLTYLFISHDLGVVEHLSDRVLIMYLGRIVEAASAEDVFARPNHPYTQALLAEVPRIELRKREFTAISGEIPSPLAPPSGCHFHPRCPHAMAVCREVAPQYREVARRPSQRLPPEWMIFRQSVYRGRLRRRPAHVTVAADEPWGSRSVVASAAPAVAAAAGWAAPADAGARHRDAGAAARHARARGAGRRRRCRRVFSSFRAGRGCPHHAMRDRGDRAADLGDRPRCAQRRENPARGAAVAAREFPAVAAGAAAAPRGLVRGRRVIGYWAWELPTVPDTWRAGLPFVHEIWALSSFTAEAFSKWLKPGAPQTVRTVPIPLAVAPPQAAALDRAAFGLPDDAVVVLVSANLASSFERKNPLGAIAAFRAAFGDRPDRLLVLKIGNPEHYSDDFSRLRDAVGGAGNIRIDTRTLPAADAYALTACADIVLSLHRSEGFGLVPAEAMLLGRAVVATGWSGNLDFMDADSAALVGYRLVPARDPRGVFEAPGAEWAEPDIAEAAAHLRRLADDPAGRAALAERGRLTATSRLGDEKLREALRGIGLPA